MKGLADELHYCPQTPPSAPRYLLPGWNWDKANSSIRKLGSRQTDSPSIRNKIE
jgi:hypothetical protein